MSDLVCDASALVFALTSTTEAALAVRERLTDHYCHAPHLVDAEVAHTLHQRERAGEISPATALAAMRAAGRMVDARYPHTGPTAELAWTLRGTFTVHDSLYLAVANALGAPLLTADARLAGAPALPCDVELVG